MRSTVLVLVAAGVAWSAVASADALDKAPFTATPAELLAAAKQAPASTASDDITVIRIDDEFRFDDHARMTESWRLVAVIRTKAGADSWDSLGYGYQPSYQDRPKARARVVDPSGQITEIDPKQFHEDPAEKNADRIDGNVTLPRLVPGSVLEEQLVISDREPMSPAGASSSLQIASSLSTRLSVVAPAALKVRPVLFGMPTVRPVHAISAGVETWRFAMAATKSPVREQNTPADLDATPRLVATSIGSWSALAKELGARVDAQIAAGPVALAGELPHAQTVAGARAILAWLQHRVEPDHVSITNSSLLPRSPAETMKLGRANDLSMAVAYVALLRQAGVTADVALISEGPGSDVHGNLPAFDGLDHALVSARLDGRDLWIDPTVDAVGITTLPSTARHRHALVLGGATTGLVDTPPITPSDNAFRDTRTYELADSGRARITEVRRFGGVWDVYTRTERRDDPKELDKNLLDDLKHRFAVDGVDKMTFTDPTAPDVPFEITSTMTSPRGYTTRPEAEVWLYPNDVTAALPDIFDKGNKPARVHDYEWSRPQIYEIEHRIIVPDGYAMPAIADRTRELGTIKLIETQRIAGNVLTVTLRLDSGKLRLTPAEVDATRAAVAGLADESIHLVFPNIAHQLYAKGAWKDAISEANRVIRAHPKEGKRHAALAELLVLMGLGDAGRREAKVAVQLEPNDADNHVVLGWALAHDLFGRPHAPGHDHAGARAELEKARKMNPKHVGAAVELGNLLAYDERGHAWASGSDPKGAVIARTAANELEPSAVHALELVRALLWASDYAGAAKVARAAAQSNDRDALLVAAVALDAGIPAALRAADGLGSTDARKHALSEAGGVLLILRRYPETRALFAETGAFGANTPQGQVFAKIARVDHPLDIKTPMGAAIEAELSVMRDDKPQGFWDAKTAEEASFQIESTMRSLTKAASLSREVYGDISRSLPTSKVEGDKRAWRIELSSAGKSEVVYAADDHGTIKLIGMPTAPFGVGRHALRLLALGEVEAAQRLLDWIDRDAKHPPLFEMVWGPNHATDRDATALAAAVLTGPSDPTHARPIVEKCNAAPPKGDAACVVTLDEINNARGAWSETIAQMSARLATHPKDPLASRILGSALAFEGRAADAEALLPDITPPYDSNIEDLKLQIALARNDVPAAIKVLQAVGKASDTNVEAFNSLAWLEVTTHTDLQDALANASESVRRSANSGNLHTKAVVEAELGDLREAIEDDRKAIDHRLRKEPGDPDWYLQGRIAELVGLREDAIFAYRRLQAPQHPDPLMLQSYELARKRLAALGKP
ncbi:MAG TPA: DUF3857 domain-containing protein [Kofleriaceae bacterium]